DRGADLFEFLATEQRLGRHCVVRSAHNRRVQIGHDGQGATALLHTHLRTLPAAGADRRKDIFDRTQGCERSVTLRVAFAAVTIQPPHVRKGDYEPTPIRAWAVRVWEEDPPADATKLEWFLVCLDEVGGVAAAWEKCDWYACRWVLEEFHKGQKTGCRI